MKICIPSTDDKGLESKVSDHFGRAPFFTIVDTESGELEVMPNPDCHSGGHGRHSCHHTGHLKARGVDAVVSGSIGHGAYSGLERAGIQVLTAGPGTVRDMVDTVKSGNAQRLVMEQTCGGGRRGRGNSHGHGDGCGQAHRHGHGRS